MTTPEQDRLDEPDVGDADDGDQAVCPNCLTPVVGRAQFCAKCNMPVGAFATLDPIKSIYAQGWGYRRAISSPPSTIVLMGMWLIFAPCTLYTVVQLVEFSLISRDDLVYVSPMYLVEMALVLAIDAVFAIILWRATGNYFRRRSIKPGDCEECGHSVQGLTEHRCPDCGTPFDPEYWEPNTVPDRRTWRLPALSTTDAVYWLLTVLWPVVGGVAGWIEAGAWRYRVQDISFLTEAGAVIVGLGLVVLGIAGLALDARFRANSSLKVTLALNCVLVLVFIAIFAATT